MSRNGILTKMDDMCRLPKASNYSIIENFKNEFSKNPYYEASKRNDLNFMINHYAGKVIYNAENFMEKNRDSLPLRVLDLFKDSKNKLLAGILSGNDSRIY